MNPNPSYVTDRAVGLPSPIMDMGVFNTREHPTSFVELAPKIKSFVRIQAIEPWTNAQTRRVKELLPERIGTSTELEVKRQGWSDKKRLRRYHIEAFSFISPSVLANAVLQVLGHADVSLPEREIDQREARRLLRVPERETRDLTSIQRSIHKMMTILPLIGPAVAMKPVYADRIIHERMTTTEIRQLLRSGITTEHLRRVINRRVNLLHRTSLQWWLRDEPKSTGERVLL